MAYESTGTLTTVTRQSDSKATTLSVAANIPTGTSIDAIVKQDESGGTTANSTQSVALSDGTNTYSLSGFTATSGASYWIEFTISTSDTSVTPSVDDASVYAASDLTGSGVGTETHTWTSESDWSGGTFTDTSTDGSGNLTLGPISSPQTFNWTLDIPANGIGDEQSRVELRDASTSTVLKSASALPGDGSKSGSWQVDVASHPDIEAYAQAGANNQGNATAQINDFQGGLVSVTDTTDDTTTETATVTKNYEYTLTGSYETADWVFSEPTTATKLSWSGVTLPNAGDAVTVTVENADGTSTHVEPLTVGSGSALFEIPPDTVYRLVVDVSTDTPGSTPAVGSLTLETHTPTTGLSVTNTRDAEADLAWDSLSVCDGYQILQAESTPVTTSDSVAYSNTDNTNTTATITGLENGEQYYWNVRAVYSGE